MNISRLCATATSACLLAACTSPGPRPGTVQRLSPEQLARIAPEPNPKVPLEEIAAASREGARPDAIIKRLSDTGTIHLLSPAQIVDLSRQGVNQKVIDYLVETQEKARQATLITQIADRDAQAAAQLERERERRLYMQRYFDPFWDPYWPRGYIGFGYYGGYRGWRW